MHRLLDQSQHCCNAHYAAYSVDLTIVLKILTDQARNVTLVHA